MPFGRMLQVSRDEVAAAVDCERCRALVEQHAPAQIDVYGPRRVDLATGAAYAIAEVYGVEDAGRSCTCPDCDRVVQIEEHHNFCWTHFPLDRDVAGR